MSNAANTMEFRLSARAAQKMRDLASDLSALVESGDLTDVEANQWMADKQDQWLGGDM